MNKICLFILLSLWMASYPITQSAFFDLERKLLFLEDAHKAIDLTLNESETDYPSDTFIQEIISYFTYPFIKKVNDEQEAILASQWIQSTKQDLYQKALSEAISQFPTTLQNKLNTTIPKLKYELNKLQIGSLKEQGSAILTDIQENVFNSPQLLQSNFSNILNAYIQKIDSLLLALQQNNLAKGLLAGSFNQLKQQLLDFKNSPTQQNTFVKETVASLDQRNKFIQKYIETAYRALFEQKLREFVLSSYDSQKDLQKYNQLKELSMLMPQASEESFKNLLESIVSIRNVMIQGLEILLHIRDSLPQTNLEPAFKAQIAHAINKKIIDILANIKNKILALPNATNMSLSTINWNTIKNEWLSTITTNANALKNRTPSINTVSENFLNTIFSLYLNPKVIASKVGLSALTGKAKNEALQIIEEQIAVYKEAAITNKNNLTYDQKVAVYNRYRKYKNLKDIFQAVMPNQEQSNTTALAQVLDIQRGGDIDAADWENEDLAGVKPLNNYIIERFDPIKNIFQKNSKNDFNELYANYADLTGRRIKAQFDESYSQWKASIHS